MYLNWLSYHGAVTAMYNISLESTIKIVFYSGVCTNMEISLLIREIPVIERIYHMASVISTGQRRQSCQLCPLLSVLIFLACIDPARQ